MMLDGKSAFITGCNRGLGRVILEKFAKEGCHKIYAHARSEKEGFEEVLRKISWESRAIIQPVYFDLQDTNALKETIKELVARKESIDILVNNAGIAHGGLFQMTDVEEVREVFEVNVFSMLSLTQAMFRILRKSEHGSIINIASVAGIRLDRGNVAYGASKATIVAETKVLAKELGPKIRVNAVAPGVFEEGMSKEMDPKEKGILESSNALKRIGHASEIAAAVTFLASDEASYITGQTLSVDGGA